METGPQADSCPHGIGSSMKTRYVHFFLILNHVLCICSFICSTLHASVLWWSWMSCPLAILYSFYRQSDSLNIHLIGFACSSMHSPSSDQSVFPAGACLDTCSPQNRGRCPLLLTPPHTPAPKPQSPCYTAASRTYAFPDAPPLQHVSSRVLRFVYSETARRCRPRSQMREIVADTKGYSF